MNLLNRALSIVNSLLIFVFLLFLIEGLNLPFLLKYGLVPVLLIKGALKLYCMSAISGCILEIISGEGMVVQLRQGHRNAVVLAPGFLVVFVIIGLADFTIFSIFPALRAWRSAYNSILELLGIFVLAQWAINIKYLRPAALPRRKVRFDGRFLLTLFLCCFLGIILVNGLGLIHTGEFHWRSIAGFLLNYVHALEFILCSLYIFDLYPEIKEKFSSQKEIFLINPMGAEVVQSLTYWFVRLHPPFFVVLRSLSPKTYKFREFNQVMWQDRYYKGNALVCITCFTSNCYEAYKIAKEFKKRGSKVVMGGPHVTYLTDEALAFCDSVIVGQAEGVWKQVLNDYEKGALKAQYKGPATEADYEQVHQELLASPPYIIKDFLETSRGCKFRCHFCSVPTLSGGQVHVQPINAFLELIEKVRPHYRQLTFIDNNIYSDPGYARELFIALKALKIKWHSQCTIDIAQNQETLKLAKESGCSGLLFGYEVSGGSLEKEQGGKFAMARKYIEYTNIVKRAGIQIKGHFIFGFDSDDLKSLFKLWKFCFAIMPQFTAVSLLTPLPGTGVYRDMLKEDRIINLNWRSYGLIRMVVRHPHLDFRAVSGFFPLIRAVFLMTTSFGGLMILVVLLFFPRYGMVEGFFR